MTPEEKQELVDGLAAKVKEKNTAEFDSIKETLNNLDVDALKELQTKKFAENETVENLKSLVDEVKESVNEVKDNLDQSKSKEMTLEQEVKAKKDEIKNIVKGKKNSVELKAVTNRASISNNTEAVRLEGFGQLAYTRRTLYDFFPKVSVGTGNHNGTIRYIDWDEDTSSKAAAMVAEGASFPESTAKFIEYSLPLRKVGDTLPVTEEFGEDEVAAAGELRLFLQNNVQAKIGEQIAVGNGSGQNLTGLNQSAPAFTAVASSIADANIKDLVRKMRTSIVKGRGSKYNPNFVAANSDVIDQYILKKDAENNYIFDMNTGTIAGLQIVEDNNLADNTLVVGDANFGRIYEMPGIMLSEGVTGDQFAQDLKTIKARARLLFLIREADKSGFAKSTDITADLATLASDPV